MNFEQGFAEVERAATGVVRTAAMLTSVAKEMIRAAREGEIAGIGKSALKLGSLAETVLQEVSNTRSAWPFTADNEERYLKEQYADELLRGAEGAGVKIQRHDGQLIAYPFIIRVLAAERAVQLNRIRLYKLRPTKVLAKLKAAQTKKSRANVQPFLEALYSAYALVSGSGGGTVTLAKIYRAFTLLPNSSVDYGRDDFARDLLTLDRSGITETKSGARFSLPASTGTKDSRDTFACVAPDGEVVTYYAIKFTSGAL